MKKYPLFKLSALLAILLLFLAACNLPERCEQADLQAPVNLDPHEEVVDPSTNVYLSWSSPLPSCQFDFFEGYIWTGMEPESPGMTGRVPFNSVTGSGTWTLFWPTPLQPGNTYFWRVSAGMETGPGPDVHGPSTLSWFYTGPVCTDDPAMQPVNLINPPDEATVDPSADITFVWDDPTPCLVHGLFEIQLSLHQDFSDYWHRIPILQTTYTPSASDISEYLSPWLQNCTRYYWRVKTDPAGAQEGPFSETWSFYAQTSGTLCPISDLTAPMAVAKLNLNCRSGPSTLYDTKDTFNQGESAPIQGRNEDGTWWQITSPHLQIPCWVWGEQVDVQGDASKVQVIQVAPPIVQPTATFTVPPPNCGRYKDPQTCNADSACFWYKPLVGGAGFCKNK